jgi:hypothetical protein
MSKVDRSEPVRGNTRIPVASNRAPLNSRGLDKENFSYRWVSDRDQRIAMFLEAGYEFVKPTAQKIVGDPTVDTISIPDRVKKSKGGTTQYLMQLPIKLYDEDQKAKQREVDEIEQSMRRPGTGKIVGSEVDFGTISFGRNTNPKG